MAISTEFNQKGKIIMEIFNEKIYITFGCSKTQLYNGGWLEINAKIKPIESDSQYSPSSLHHIMMIRAIRAVMALYDAGDKTPMPFAFFYSEQEFKATSMYEKNSNLGHGCWEVINIDMT